MIRESKVLFKIVQANKWSMIGLAALMSLTSVLNAVSIVSVFPLIEFVFYDGTEGSAGGVSGYEYSKVSAHVRQVLEGIGVGVDSFSVVALMLAVFIAKAALSVSTVYCTNAFAQKVRRFWVDVVCRRYFYASFRSVGRLSAGAIANNVLREPTQAGQFVRAYLDYVNRVLLSATIIGGMLYVEWKFVAAIVACLGILFPLLHLTLTKRSSAYGRRHIMHAQESAGLAAEIAHGIKQIHIVRSEEYFRGRLMTVMQGLSRLVVATQMVKELPRIVVELLVVVVGLAVVLLLEATYEGDARSLLPSLMFFGIALSRLTSMFAEVMSFQMTCMNKAPSAQLLVQLLHDKTFDPAVEATSGSLPFRQLQSDIFFNNVIFSYDPHAVVLDRLSCVVPRGQLTCFVGPSGCGKSTLMDLLMRLYDPDGGSIEAGGKDIRHYRLSDWRGRIGYISQDASTFSASLRENITLGRSEVSDKRLNELAAILRLDGLVASMERGWDTVVGQEGITLSGGERKRLAIMRALLTDPDLLIFDEATVSFQEGLEQELLTHIRSFWPNITIVLITHRLSTIAAADLVHVLDHGRVIASGTEAEVRSVAQLLLVSPDEKSADEPADAFAMHLSLDTN